MRERYGHNTVPHLFQATGGIDPHLATYIAKQERLARENDSDFDATWWPNSMDFHARGVAKICLDLLEEIEARQNPRKDAKGLPPDGGSYCKSWCYALHIYCANHGERATPELLCLTFRVLGCTELMPHGEMREDLGITPKVDKRAQFLRAIDLDAEHWARYGRQCPDQKLAALVGDVSDGSIKNWRKEAEYLRRLPFEIRHCIETLERADEGTARDSIDFAALSKRSADAQVAAEMGSHTARKNK